MYEAFDPAHKAGQSKNPWNDKAHPLARKRGREEKNLPVVNVTWYNAWNFAKWVGDDVFLPSELQWEHACRAGSGTKYYFGNEESELAEHASDSSNSTRRTHPMPPQASDHHDCNENGLSEHARQCGGMVRGLVQCNFLPPGAPERELVQLWRVLPLRGPQWGQARQPVPPLRVPSGRSS